MRVVEAFLITAAILISMALMTGQDAIPAASVLILPLLIVFGILTTMQLTGLYGLVALVDLRVLLTRIAVTTGLVFLLAVITTGQLAKYDIVKIYPYRWQWTFGLTAVWLLCVLAPRYILNQLIEKGFLTRRIVVVGDRHESERLRNLSRQFGERFVVAAQIQPSAADFDSRLVALASALHAPEIVVCSDDAASGMPACLAVRNILGVPIYDIQTFYERETGRVDLHALDENWLAQTKQRQAHLVLHYAKRVLDIMVALLAFAATAPVMALAALAIYLQDHGPILFRQTRVGLGGRHFVLYKFRSMRVDAEAGTAPLWAAENDPRITRVGAVIRKFRIDALPQFFNVLRGDMSFIGPRPERPYFVQQFAVSIPFYAARHTVKPGITGWAQVSFHYGASYEDACHKTAYDLYYVKHRRILLDVLILVRTIKVVLWPRGVR